MDFVKFGIIGAGGAWGFHSAGCRNSEVVKFVSVFDINTKNAERMAKRYRINEMKAYSDLDEFLHFGFQDHIMASDAQINVTLSNK